MPRIFGLTCAMLLLTNSATGQDVKTLKERLSDKASDAQRIDNCHVPPERRGPVPRPDCAGQAQSARPEAKKEAQ